MVIGCPHCSISELRQIAAHLDGKKISNSVELWVLTSHAVRAMAQRMGLTDVIEKAGGKIIVDTCPDVITRRTLENLGHRIITTNATVFAHSIGEYSAPHYFDNHIHYGRLKKCLDSAVSGAWR